VTGIKCRLRLRYTSLPDTRQVDPCSAETDQMGRRVGPMRRPVGSARVARR